MRITIPNFEKYNPRGDVKHASWLRMQNDLFTDDRLFDATAITKLSWVYLLCLRSKHGDGSFLVNANLAASLVPTTAAEFVAAIDWLEKQGLVVVDERTRADAGGDGRTRADSIAVRAGGRTDGRDGTNGTGRDERTPRAHAHTPARVVDMDEPDDFPSAAPPAPILVVAPPPPPRQPKPLSSEADLAVGKDWLAFALEEMPWKCDDKTWTPENFAFAIAKLRRATNLNDDGVVKVLAFIKGDEFWRKNAVSPNGLLRKSDRNGQRKIDNIIVRMRTPINRAAESAMQWAKA